MQGDGCTDPAGLVSPSVAIPIRPFVLRRSSNSSTSSQLSCPGNRGHLHSSTAIDFLGVNICLLLLLSLFVAPSSVLEGASTMPCHQERAESRVRSKKGPPVPTSWSPLLAGYLQSSRTVLKPFVEEASGQRKFPPPPWIKIWLANDNKP